jgi:hypothetical protein
MKKKYENDDDQVSVFAIGFRTHTRNDLLSNTSDVVNPTDRFDDRKHDRQRG